MKGYQCGNYCNNDLITVGDVDQLNSIDGYPFIVDTIATEDSDVLWTFQRVKMN